MGENSSDSSPKGETEQAKRMMYQITTGGRISLSSGGKTSKGATSYLGNHNAVFAITSGDGPERGRAQGY